MATSRDVGCFLRVLAKPYLSFCFYKLQVPHSEVACVYKVGLKVKVSILNDKFLTFERFNKAVEPFLCSRVSCSHPEHLG